MGPSVHFGPVEVRCFSSCVDNPRPVTRTRDPSYSWPPEIRCLNSIREHRRAHMKAVMRHEQVKLDDTDRSGLNDGPCVVQLTVDKRSASEMKVAAAKGMSRKRRFMLDSGCGIDLIGYSDLSSEERNMISDVAKLTLRTANGKTSTRGVAHMIVEGIEELIEVHVLESTQSLLSLGKRCLEHGYRFVWEPFAEPKFYDPHGTPVRIGVIDKIPYLIPSETTVVSNKYRAIAESRVKLVLQGTRAALRQAGFLVLALRLSPLLFCKEHCHGRGRIRVSQAFRW